jgi:hypothetical protein
MVAKRKEDEAHFLKRGCYPRGRFGGNLLVGFPESDFGGEPEQGSGPRPEKPCRRWRPEPGSRLGCRTFGLGAPVPPANGRRQQSLGGVLLMVFTIIMSVVHESGCLGLRWFGRFPSPFAGSIA